MSTRRFLMWVSVLVLCSVAAPLILSSANVAEWILTGFDALVVLGLVLLMGYTGQPSLGQAAFFGIGAYAVAILTTRDHWKFLPAAIFGIVLAVVIALVIGAIIFRLKGHFLALATVAVGYIVYSVMGQSKLTGGAIGISGVPPLSFFGHVISSASPTIFSYIVWALVVLVLLGMYGILKSPGGMALRAIREDEKAASSLGIRGSRYKLQVFALSAAVAALAGAFYAPYVGYVASDPFGVATSIQFLLMASIGGMTNLFGAVVGTVVVSFLGQGLTEVASRVPGWNPSLLELIVYGGLLVAIMVFRPEGILTSRGKHQRLKSHNVGPTKDIGPGVISHNV